MPFEIKGLGGVTAPRGFSAAGVTGNIKGKGSAKRDVAVLYSQVPAAAAGVFTTNAVKAAPLVVTAERLRSGRLQAIIANSGNANACTGRQGLADAYKMTELAGQALELDPGLVAVASTGVIGVSLPMERVAAGIQAAAAALSVEGASDAAQAIMTTDTFPKEWAVQVQLRQGSVTIGGMAKGSGMIHPNLATMLAFVTTDAALAPADLQATLGSAVAKSFNMITVDGDTSTNDCVLIMANGLSGAPPIRPDTEDWHAFCSGLDALLIHLAKAVARDGEGATRLIEVRITGANSVDDARKAARAVVGSSLVKAAVFGEDANWGRIVAAVGYSGADFDPEIVDVYLGSVPVMAQGTGLRFDEEAARKALQAREVIIRVDLHQDSHEATAWGCDLTYDYVKINADYRT